MAPPKRTAKVAVLSLAISLIGLLLLPLMLFSNPIQFLSIPWQKQTFGAAFALICVFGFGAAISPSHCSPSFCFKTKKSQPARKTITSKAHRQSVTKRGHHPTCGHFSGHVLSIGDSLYCAGCTGLAMGAVIALLGLGLYFFIGVAASFVSVLFWLGFTGVAVGLLQHSLYSYFKVERGIIRVVVNIFFVIGSLFLLVTVFEITNDFVLNMYLLLLILYWIFTRVVLSNRAHRKICAKCQVEDCVFSEA